MWLPIVAWMDAWRLDPDLTAEFLGLHENDTLLAILRTRRPIPIPEGMTAEVLLALGENLWSYLGAVETIRGQRGTDLPLGPQDPRLSDLMTTLGISLKGAPCL
jgi:hypothetical protein